MSTTRRIQEILEQIRALNEELADRLHEQQEKAYYHLQGKKVEFEEAVKLRHKQVKENVVKYIALSQWRTLLSAPIIYSMIVPMLLLDLSLFVYQAICFRLYQIKPIKRSEYIRIDRHHLSYLNIIEKINCVYCGYGNGLLSYAREIASLTEQYWCPIKHASKVLGSHDRYLNFLDYGDAENYRNKVKEFRREIIATDKE